MTLKEIGSKTIFGTTKIQLWFGLKNRIIAGDFQEVNKTPQEGLYLVFRTTI